MTSKYKRPLFFFFAILLLLPTCIIFLIYGLRGACLSYSDGFHRWQECAYCIRGIYPMDIVQGITEPLPQIGIISHDITTIPWIYILGNFLYPCFLNWSVAKIYSIILFFVLIAVYSVTLFKSLRPFSSGRVQRLFLVILSLTHFGWGSSLNKMNNGMFTCISLMLVLLLTEYYGKTLRSDFLIGFLMMIAMLKPQIAILFFIPLFWQKRYRSICISGAFILSGWLSASLLCGRATFRILLDQFQLGSKLNTVSYFCYYGLFDFLLDYGISSVVLILGQAALFGTLALFLGYKLRNYSNYLQFSFMAVISISWCYNHNMDMAILGLLSLSSAMLLLQKTTIRTFESTYLIFMLFFILIPILHVYYELYPALPFIQRMLYFGEVYILIRYRNYYPRIADRCA